MACEDDLLLGPLDGGKKFGVVGLLELLSSLQRWVSGAEVLEHEHMLLSLTTLVN